MIFAKVTQPFDGMDGNKVKKFRPGMTLDGELAQTAIDNHCAEEITGAAAKKLQAAYDKKAERKKPAAGGDEPSDSGDTGDAEEVEASEETEETEEAEASEEEYDELEEEAVVDEGGEEAEVVEPEQKPRSRARTKK